MCRCPCLKGDGWRNHAGTRLPHVHWWRLSPQHSVAAGRGPGTTLELSAAVPAAATAAPSRRGQSAEGVWRGRDGSGMGEGGGDTAKVQCRGTRGELAVGAVQRRGARPRTAFMRRVTGQAARLFPSPTVPPSAWRASAHRRRSHWCCRRRNWRNCSGLSLGASSALAAEADATPVEPRGGRRRAAGGGGPPSAAATGPAVALTGGVACGVRGAAGAVGVGLGCLTLPERPHARNEQLVAAAAPEPANGVTATSTVASRRLWRRRCRHRAAPSCDRGAAGGGGGEGNSGSWQRCLWPLRRARLCGPRGAAVASASRRHRPARGSGRQWVAPPLRCRRL